MNDQKKFEPRPTTDLDFQAQLTEPFISGDYVKPSFRNRFVDYRQEFTPLVINGKELKDEFGHTRFEVVLDEDGNPVVNVNKDLYSVLNLWMRDWRLGNLRKDDVYYVKYYLDSASDILTVLPECFRSSALICIERALSVVELSQSRGGFLRNLLNTFIHKTNNLPNQDEGGKRSLFGLGKKKNNNVGGY